MRIAVTYNQLPVSASAGGSGVPGGSPPAVVREVAGTLSSRYGEASLLPADETVFKGLMDARPDLVFNMADGVTGEAPEAQMPAVFEMLGIPYTGAGPMAAALCAHRARAKEVLSYYGIPTPGFVVTGGADLEVDALFPFPLVVKPAYGRASAPGGGASTSPLSVVSSQDELAECIDTLVGTHARPVIIEEFVPGREFSVTLVGNGEGMRAVAVSELAPATAAFSGVADAPQGAALGDRLAGSVTRVAVDAARAVGMRDWCEVIIRLSLELVPNVISLRTRPELAAGDADSGPRVDELAVEVTEHARARYAI